MDLEGKLDDVSPVITPEEIAKNIRRIPAEEYFSRFLRDDDASAIKNIIRDITQHISRDFTIIAVGESTYPKEFWNLPRVLSEYSEYQNIDLLLVPKINIDSDILASEVKRSFDKEKRDYYQSRFSGFFGIVSDKTEISYSLSKKPIISPYWFKAYPNLRAINTPIDNCRYARVFVGNELPSESYTLSIISRQLKKDKMSHSIIYNQTR